MVPLRHFRRAFRGLPTGSVRPEDITIVAGDLHAPIPVGVKPTFAIERADSPLFGVHRIQRLEAGELDVEPGPRPVVEGLKRAARRSIPFAVDLAGLAPDPLELRLQQAGDVL